MTGTEKMHKQIANNVAIVRQKMDAAATKSGRNASDITLLGVTKTQSAEAVRALLAAGVTEIGENRVQELLEKKDAIADIAHNAHLIGHLQRNKTKYLPGNVSMVQSVDSNKLADSLAKSFSEEKTPLDILIEVNIGEEMSKNGVAKENLFALVEHIETLPSLRLRGLMAIPPFGLGERVRVYFQQMYQLFIDIQAQKMDNKNVNILSMGMSDDFEYAILEGSTMVRVGTSLFGPRV